MRNVKPIYLFAIMAVVIVFIGQVQSWQLALAIVNLCLISSIMALGVNIQWGYAGLFNVGIMGFAALGGMAAIVVSMSPIGEAWEAGAAGVGIAGIVVAITAFAAFYLRKIMTAGRQRSFVVLATVAVGYFVARSFSTRQLIGSKTSIQRFQAIWAGLACPSFLPGLWVDFRRRRSMGCWQDHAGPAIRLSGDRDVGHL